MNDSQALDIIRQLSEEIAELKEKVRYSRGACIFLITVMLSKMLNFGLWSGIVVGIFAFTFYLETFGQKYK